MFSDEKSKQMFFLTQNDELNKLAENEGNDQINNSFMFDSLLLNENLECEETIEDKK